jgi:hypothetical protein
MFHFKVLVGKLGTIDGFPTLYDGADLIIMNSNYYHHYNMFTVPLKFVKSPPCNYKKSHNASQI